ncbi:hypothetical protein [Chryseobacterium sp.]|uniref:hypothetical protein n=1 Tax=Chryseobacterium sp. TaxID=1871047 RepID=UPI002FC730C6
MNEIIIIGGRSHSKAELNTLLTKLALAYGISFKDVFTKFSEFNSSCAFKNCAEEFNKAAEELKDLTVELNRLEKFKTFPTSSVNPFDRQYKRKRR